MTFSVGILQIGIARESKSSAVKVVGGGNLDC